MGIKKAADKLAKEEVEQIDELSKKTLGSYVKKASADRSWNSFSRGHLAGMEADHDAKKMIKKDQKRMFGINRATDKLAKEEVEELDELKKSTLASYVKKSAGVGDRNSLPNAMKDQSTAAVTGDREWYKKSGRTATNRSTGIQRAADRLAKEEVELDEISKSTAASYIKKAVSSSAALRAKADLLGKRALDTDSPKNSEKYFDASDKAYKKHMNRISGTAKAVDRLTKEEAEIEEKKLTPKEIKAALGAAKAKPKDKVSVAKAPWDMKKESVQTEAATATRNPGVASPRGEGLSPSAKKELARTTPMPDFVNEPAVDKKSFDTIRASGKKAPARHGDALKGDKNIINKPLDITARASKKEDDGFKDA